MAERGITRKRNGNASRIGKAVELLIAATCILASYGELNASAAMVDDDGVDLTFHHRSGTATVAVQVKARTMDTTVLQRERFQADVRPGTFRPLDNRFLLFVAVDTHQATFGPVWLVPSRAFQEQAFRIGNGKFRFTASMKAASADRWRPYRLTKSELPAAILEVMAQREAQQPGQRPLRPAASATQPPTAGGSRLDIDRTHGGDHEPARSQ